MFLLSLYEKKRINIVLKRIHLKYIHSIYFGTAVLHQLLMAILKVGSLMAAALTSAVKSSPSGALHKNTPISITGGQKGQINPIHFYLHSAKSRQGQRVIAVVDSLGLVADVHARRQDAPPFSEALHSVPGNHHAVVGAEFGGRAEQLQPRGLGDDAQRLADVLVTGNSSGKNLQVGQQTPFTPVQVFEAFLPPKTFRFGFYD